MHIPLLLPTLELLLVLAMIQMMMTHLLSQRHRFSWSERTLIGEGRALHPQVEIYSCVRWSLLV